MTTLRRMTAVDLFCFSAVNADFFTETFVQHFYVRYLTNWPELCLVAEGFDGAIAGYIIGKVEGNGMDWHGHVTAFSVAPEYRHSGVAQQLMYHFEQTCEERLSCYYVDLFVRVSNTVAVKFYRRLGYRVWKTRKGYYSGEEDALDMRKPLPRDIHHVCMQNAEEKSSPPESREASGSTSDGNRVISCSVTEAEAFCLLPSMASCDAGTYLLESAASKTGGYLILEIYHKVHVHVIAWGVKASKKSLSFPGHVRGQRLLRFFEVASEKEKVFRLPVEGDRFTLKYQE